MMRLSEPAKRVGNLQSMGRVQVERTVLRAVAGGAACALALALPVARAREQQAAHPAASALRGFSAARSTAEEQWETKFAQLPSALRAEATLRRLTSEPHMAGTEASHRVAEYLREEYTAAGLEAEIVPYNVVLSYPGE